MTNLSDGGLQFSQQSLTNLVGPRRYDSERIALAVGANRFSLKDNTTIFENVTVGVNFKISSVTDDLNLTLNFITPDLDSTGGPAIILDETEFPISWQNLIQFTDIHITNDTTASTIDIFISGA